MDIEEMADKFIAELRERAYGPGNWSNKQEGDLGTWDDWRQALVEFGNRVRGSITELR